MRSDRGPATWNEDVSRFLDESLTDANGDNTCGWAANKNRKGHGKVSNAIPPFHGQQ